MKDPFHVRRKDFERDAIRKAIEAAKGNKVKAAKNLSISRATLYRHLNRFGL